MSRNEALKNWYADEFGKLINDGYMTEVTAEEDAQWKSNGGKVYYISGGICSVAMLIIAEKFKDKYPQVYEFIKSNLYVDDGTTIVDDVSTALQLAKELNIVPSEASVIIKHFMIGGSESDIDDHIKKCPDLSDNVRRAPEQERILGIIYHSANDEISISGRINFSKKRRGIRSEEDISLVNFDDDFPDTFSRRNYLQIIATIYDPTGFATPTAYGCVAYYNRKLENGERASVLAMSKAKPWPQIPTLTIPRGELLGCLLGARMQQTIVKKSTFIFERVMLLTDSTIVLEQLRHEPFKYNMWTACRISEIQTLTDIRDWYHVNSGNNVADDASHGLNPSEMGKDSR
ncbi:uncharacterized protein [Palaemon carinicauda]|uniref:uncharacterized protein n=1 Tax=Palaemon carinicauda TaxID=392227 RepID=UPI0035B676E4